MNDNYDLVLYYCKNSKPSEPNFEAIKKEILKTKKRNLIWW